MTWLSKDMRPAVAAGAGRAGGVAVALVAVGTAAAVTTRATVAPDQQLGPRRPAASTRGQHAHGQPRHVERLGADHVPVPVWEICDGNGAGCHDIAGATAQTYS